MNLKLFASMGALLGFLAVAFGAFGAHGLKTKVAPEMLIIFETGVRYQMYHALALLFIACLALNVTALSLNPVGWLWTAGTLIFSGSLYILVLTGVKTWGAVTPVGGLFLLIGWGLLFIKLIKL